LSADAWKRAAMTGSKPTIEIVHNAAESRFEARVKGLLCVAVYRLSDGVMRMTHTEVPPMLEGRGIASKLVAAAVEYARANDFKIAPLCSYVRVWMRRHPQAQDLLADGSHP
jgi:predicted GNAT family acetyltransferase